MVSTPSRPSVTLEAKNAASVILDSTYVHSTMLASPFLARKHASANKAPAYAIESVAEPLPALAATTSVPPSCVRLVNASISASDKLLALGVA